MQHGTARVFFLSASGLTEIKGSIRTTQLKMRTTALYLQGWQHWQIRLYPNSDPSKVITYSTEDPSGFFEFTPMTLNEYGFGPGEYTLIVDGERYLDRVWDR